MLLNDQRNQKAPIDFIHNNHIDNDSYDKPKVRLSLSCAAS